MPADADFDDLVEQVLGRSLPPELTGLVPLEEMPPDAQGFVRRALDLMKRAAYPPTDINPALLRWLTTIRTMLPGGWGDTIPPITLPGRHGKIDDYVASLGIGPANDASPVFVDMGCGFPPATTAETARRLAGWRIFGVDRSFAEYVLYDREGHYACFGKDGEFRYFQALMSSGGRTLYADPEAAKNRFRLLFSELFPLLGKSAGLKSETVEKGGDRLIHHHIRDFETDNLTFIRADLADLRLDPATVIRCMNLFLYFSRETRREMLHRCGDLLDDDGIVIVGTNGLGIQTRYTVFRKTPKGLTSSEFAFTLDNLGPIVFMPWFTIHDDDPEAALLVQMARAVRADTSFWRAFGSRVDQLLDDHGICRRGPGGFLCAHREMDPREYLVKNAQLWSRVEAEGFGERAVDALKRSGYDAWTNPVGDIAVRPPDHFMF